MSRILKYIGLVVIVALLMAVLINAYNSQPSVIISKVFKNVNLKPQALKYRAYGFGFIPLGEALFNKAQSEELNGVKVYHCHATAKSLDMVSLFFKGEAVLDSYVDAKSGNPMLFRQKVSASGKEAGLREVIYDQKQGYMTLAGVRRQIVPNTQDPLSLIYNLMRMDFEKTKTIDFSINTKHKNYIIKGTVEAKSIVVSGSEYKIYTVKARIRRNYANPYHQSQATIIFLKAADENIPILIKVFANGFLINARLAEAR